MAAVDFPHLDHVPADRGQAAAVGGKGQIENQTRGGQGVHGLGFAGQQRLHVPDPDRAIFQPGRRQQPAIGAEDQASDVAAMADDPHFLPARIPVEQSDRAILSPQGKELAVRAESDIEDPALACQRLQQLATGHVPNLDLVRYLRLTMPSARSGRLRQRRG